MRPLSSTAAFSLRYRVGAHDHDIHATKSGAGLRACAQRLDIADRWLSEEALVLAIELAGTFVSDLKGRARRVEFVDEHLLPSGVQAQLLLELKRAHCRESTKVMMQRRSAHSRYACQFIHL
jgi:hypothetical protein